MTCSEAKALFSPYLDGVLSGSVMRSLSDHMAECRGCAREYTSLKYTQSLVAGLGRIQPPPELTLKLRVLASRQAANRRHPAWESLRVRLSDALEAFMVPATAGALTAIVFFGLLIGFFAMPSNLQASNSDDVVPRSLYTPPQLVMSPFSAGIHAGNNGPLVVEAVIDPSGRVQDYRILSAPPDYDVMDAQLENMLIFTVFQPALSFGRPTTGRTVLSFSKINVQG